MSGLRNHLLAGMATMSDNGRVQKVHLPLGDYVPCIIRLPCLVKQSYANRSETILRHPEKS